MFRLTLTTLIFAASTYGGPQRTLMSEVSSSSTYNMEVNLLTETDHHVGVSCTANGIFQIPGSCQSFYQCDDWDGLDMRMYFFICPPGTVFDDRLSICNDPSWVKTTPVCEGTTGPADLALGENVTATRLTLNTIQNRIKRSSLTEEDYFYGGHEVPLEYSDILDVSISSGEDTIDGNNTSQLFNTTEEDIKTPLCDNIVEEEDNSTESQLIGDSALLACEQMYEVDQYVDMVISMVPLRYPDFMREVFDGSVVDNYNTELKEAQINTYPWRRGESIMKGFRRTFELAKLFGPEFARKYSVSQDRINKLDNSTITLRVEQEIRESIQAIEKELELYYDLILKDPTLQTIFLPLINTNREQLQKRKDELRELQSLNRELDEIIAFLQFVKIDAGDIMKKANATKQKMLIFKDNLLQDQQSFKASEISAKNAINDSIKQIEFILKEVDKHMTRRKELEDKGREIEDDIRKKENQIYTEIALFKNKMNNFNQKLEESNRLAAEGAEKGLAGYNCFFGLIYCGGYGDKLVNKAREMTKSIPRQIQMQSDAYTKVMDTRVSLLNMSSIQLSENRMNLFKLDNKLEESKFKALTLEYVGVYMETVVEEAERILPYIEDAILGLSGLLKTFRNVVFELESMISEAQKIKEPAERRNFRQFFSTNMTMMLNHWNESYSDIISVGSCTDPEFYSEVTEMIKARRLHDTSCSEPTTNITTDFDMMFPTADQGAIDYNLTIPIYDNDY